MMPNFPKISIVTPSFNQAPFIEDTIQSVLDQGYPNLEYVIIDGGSSDGSVDKIKKYENKLHFWVSEKDNGHGHALNKGFTHTNGEIMAWLNSDDKYMPWTFKVVAEIFTLFPHVNWIVGFNSWWNDDGVITSASRVPKNIYDFLLGRYGWIQQESVFWRRSLWEKAGGNINEDFDFMVDGSLWCRFFLHDDLYSLDCILGGYRHHSDNRSIVNYDSCLQEMEKAIDDMKKTCPEDVLKKYYVLNAVFRLQNFTLFRHLPISKLGRKILPAFKSVKYKNISYTNGTWHERTLPFSL